MLSKAACIIPTHGRPGHLSRALESVLQQSHAPAEIIVVDDLDDGPTAAVVQVSALRTEIPTQSWRVGFTQRRRRGEPC